MKISDKVISKLNNEIILCSNSYSDNASNILIIGVMHGDEPQGKFLVEKYLETNNITKNNLFFIPCLNPDGMQLKTRQNSNSVDINRNFSTKNWTLTEKNDYWGGMSPTSEVETQFIEKIITTLKPKIILALHSPYKVVNYDGPAEKFAQNISEIINYPVQKDIGYPTPGSFGTYAGVERNIPTITLELDEEIPVESLIKPVNAIFEYLGNC